MRYILVLSIILLSFKANALNFEGKRFWLTFLQSDPSNKEMILQIDITSRVFTKGVIKMKLKNSSTLKPETFWIVNFEVKANAVTRVLLDKNTFEINKFGRITPYAIYIETVDGVNVFASNNSGNSTDATQVLPIESLGFSYMVVQYQTTTKNTPTQYTVVATEDSTIVEIINTKKDKENHSIKIPFTITLDKGQYISIQSDNDLTGSEIKSLNEKKIAVFSGVVCAYVPKVCQSCDHLYEQMIPINYLKYEYAVIPFYARGKDIMRIVSTKNNTKVLVNNAENFIAKKGEFLEFEINKATHVLAKEPVTIVQYAVGTSCDNKMGDPSMVILKPLSTYTGTQVLPTVSNENIKDYYINIVLNTSDVNKIRINGKEVKNKDSKLHTEKNISYLRISLLKQTNIIHCNCEYTFVSYGFGNYESYAY